MKTTSNERRKVASRLRSVTGEDLSRSRLQDILNYTVGGLCIDKEGHVDKKLIIRRLADLIDPTSRAIYKGRQVNYNVWYGCSVCNFGWFENVHDMPYSYCPHCGARLVDKDHS